MITTKDRIKIYFKGWGVGWPALKAVSQNTKVWMAFAAATLIWLGFLVASYEGAR